MEQNHWPVRITRRSFVKVAGLMAGAVALPDLTHVSFASKALRVGVMLPSATLYPDMGKRFVAGMKTGFSGSDQAEGLPVELVVKSIGPGYSAASKASHYLLENERVDLVVGMVGSGVAAMLNETYRAHDRFLVAANLGANIIRPDESGSHLVYSTLDLWQASWLSGQWAFQQGGQRAFVAMSFYDSGYDMPYAFRLGFEQAGGTIAGTLVSHRPVDDGDLSALMAALAEAEPDVVYAAYCGKAGAEFLQAYADAGLAARIPLLGAPYLPGNPAAGSIKTALPWTSKLNSTANRTFQKGYGQATGSPADLIAVLGYDTARLVAGAPRDSGSDLQAALLRAAGDSPRGKPRISRDVYSLGGPLYLCDVSPRQNTSDALVLAEFPGIDEDQIRRQVASASPKTGWIHPYLCL